MAARNLRLKRKKFVGILFNKYTLSADARKLNEINHQLVAAGYWPLPGCADDPENAALKFREWSAIAEFAVVLHEIRPKILQFIAGQSNLLPGCKFFSFAVCNLW